VSYKARLFAKVLPVDPASAKNFTSSTRRHGETPRILRFMAGFSYVDELGKLVINLTGL
jgi:hypothetical protein